MNKYISTQGSVLSALTFAASSVSAGQPAITSPSGIAGQPEIISQPAISGQPVMAGQPAETGLPVITSPSGVFGGNPVVEALSQNPLLWSGILLLVLLAVGLSFYIVHRLKSRRTKVPGAGVSPMITEQKVICDIGNVQHIGKRDSQQDSFGISDLSNKALCSEKGLLAIVADGMGGLANGAEVSALVTRSMLGQFTERPFALDPSQELLNILCQTNKEVNLFLKDCREKSGSTVVAAAIKDMKLHWVSVGDSRICLVRKGVLFQINREHTYASELDQKAALGEITFEKARSDPQRNALTSYIGMGALEKIDRSIRALQLVAEDRILLMSDGVFGTLSDDEILSAMQLSPHESAMELEKLILQKNKGGQDNFTAILIELR